jgi:hypothetical protein
MRKRIMRRSNRGNIFVGLTFNSFGVLAGIVGLMFVFAKNLGEAAIPAINMMTLMLYIPITTLAIGILGWMYSGNSD